MFVGEVEFLMGCKRLWGTYFFNDLRLFKLVLEKPVKLEISEMCARDMLT